MSGLDNWLKQATRRLSTESAAQVRTEIREHYKSERESAMAGGRTVEEADRSAVAALGDPVIANCQYREVLLTAAEATALAHGRAEARAICSRPWLKRLLLAAPVAAILAATALLVIGATGVARVLLTAGIGIGILFAGPFLPVYTPWRARAFRVLKWLVFAGMLALAFGPEASKWSWLLISCMWPLAWTEWTRIAIRRKMRVGDWPKHLYL